MSSGSEKYTRRRLRSSYISVVVSIALVLFVLGIFGLLLVNVQTITNQVRENFAINILIKNDAPEAAVRKFQKSLQLSDYVKSLEYITKEDAVTELQKELDEDFMEFLGYNPLLDAIEVKLKAEFVNPEKISMLEQQFQKETFVSEVVYDKPLIQVLNENIERIGIILLAGCILLTLIAIGLINSSIRLSIYSKRFLIKTMQLVGATKNFIRRPFIWRSFRHGIYGSLIALGLLAALLYYTGQHIPDFRELQVRSHLIILSIALFVVGIFISMICTFFALKKYLKLKTDQLYF